MLFSFFRLLYFFILSTPFFYFLFQYNQIIEIYSPFSWNFARTISTFFPLERYSKPQIIIHLFSYLILFLRLFFFFFFSVVVVGPVGSEGGEANDSTTPYCC